jgi:hypothetical protein
MPNVKSKRPAKPARKMSWKNKPIETWTLPNGRSVNDTTIEELFFIVRTLADGLEKAVAPHAAAYRRLMSHEGTVQ